MRAWGDDIWQRIRQAALEKASQLEANEREEGPGPSKVETIQEVLPKVTSLRLPSKSVRAINSLPKLTARFTPPPAKTLPLDSR